MNDIETLLELYLGDKERIPEEISKRLLRKALDDDAYLRKRIPQMKSDEEVTMRLTLRLTCPVELARTILKEMEA